LTAAQLAALKLGVATMMSRPASDPTSWSYQAAMHGSLVTPALALWNECEHGTDQFLSWHRLFLHRFEAILRKASGSPSLMLPFWDWTNHRDLPAAFRDSTPGNSLFTTHRGGGINAGALLPASAVNYGAAFPQVPFTGFSSSLEGTPHGAVHVSIGGWMGSVPTAAQDPIFWLHHANIDRLWSLWLAQGGGRADPTSATWLDHKFPFFNENGAQVTMTPRQTLDSCRNLGYVYEKVTRTLRINPKLLAGALLTVAATGQVAVEATNTEAVQLGPKQAEISIPVGRAPDTVKRAMVSGTTRKYISFDDISVTDPEGYYEVYLDPPAGKPLEFTDPSYIGNLVLFGLGPSAGVGHKNMGPASRTLEITGKLAALGARATNPDSALRVVLVLREPEGAGAAKSQAPRALVGHVRLLTSQ
jgi:tyrosinase